MLGIGTTWELHDGATPGAYTAVGKLLSLNPPSDNIDVIDVTTMDSADFTREFEQGLNDPGEASLTFIWTPGGAEDDLIQAWRTARGVRSQRITWPNGVVWTFDMMLTGFKPDAPIDDKMTAEVTGKVTSSYIVS